MTPATQLSPALASIPEPRPKKVPSTSSHLCNYFLVGEAPGETEVLLGAPFVGSSGQELDRMLGETGWLRSEAFITNVCKYRPEDNDIEGMFTAFNPTKKLFTPGPLLSEGIAELWQDLDRLRPRIVLAFGNTALWALTGHWGITDWRGSVLESRPLPDGTTFKVIPTYHPAAILRKWEWRAIALHDLRRAKAEFAFPEVRPPAWDFTVRPSLQTTLLRLKDLSLRAEQGPLPLAIDLETRRGHLACCAIAWSSREAISIPFLAVERPEGYWSLDDECAVYWELYLLLTHPNVQCIFQNGAYDCQYFAKEFGYIPNFVDDTMVAHHLCFRELPKALHFIASMYCAWYAFWKDDGKEWDPRKTPEDQLWIYNCTDAVYTFEAMQVLRNVLVSCKQTEQYKFKMQHLQRAVLRMMLRGVRIDLNARAHMAQALTEAGVNLQNDIDYINGRPLNIRSSLQMKDLFYTQLGMPVIKNKISRQPTMDKNALAEIKKREPLLGALIDRITLLRSVGVFFSTFIKAPLDSDGRMRCSYGISATVTDRFNSSANAFGSGTNLQNIPKGNEKDEDGNYEIDGELIDATSFELPAIRKIFVPDSGYEIFDVDLAGADAQVVAWDADDPILKQMFREGKKIHAENAKDLFGKNAGPDGKREPYYSLTKRGVHATNYVCKPPTLAKHLNMSVHEASKFQKRWFDIHPWILAWHRRIEGELQSRRAISNIFGYHRHFFGRIEELLPEAVAWIPQSTVAIVCNMALCQVDENLPEVQLLLQVHDSLVGQYPIPLRDAVLPRLRQHLSVRVPYSDPLVIPWGLKVSTQSWGHVKELKWPTAVNLLA